MKTIRFLSFLLILSFIFISCENEEPEKNEFYPLGVSVEDGGNYDIDSVVAKIAYSNKANEWDTVAIASSAYSRGNFFLFLPKILDEKYLVNATTIFNPGSFDMYDEYDDLVLVSDTTAKIKIIPLLYAYKGDKETGCFYSSGKSLVYTNKPFNIVGSYVDPRFIAFVVDRFDIRFKQGWNFFNHRKLITEIEDCPYCDEYMEYQDYREAIEEPSIGILVAEYTSNDITDLKWHYSELNKEEEDTTVKDSVLMKFRKPSYLKRR